MNRKTNGQYQGRVDWSDLYELYVKDKLTMKEIANKKGCTFNAVSVRLRRDYIPRRTRSESAFIVWSRPHKKGGTSGKECNLWRGGRKTVHGYILVRIPNHPYSGKNGYVPQHRLVVEKRLGRYLLPSEKVHHINGIKDDNRDENLQLFSCQAEHLTTIISGKRIAKLELEVKNLAKENKLLKWQIRHLSVQLQYKIEVDNG